MTESKQANELKNTSYELFILLLSLLSLFNLAMLLIPGVDPVIKQVVAAIDVPITIIFILDFLYRLLTAESKSAYIFRNYGWADFLASLPVQQLKIFRIFRVVRVFRLLRIIGWRSMWFELRYNRAGSALYLTVFLVILLLEFGGIAIVFTEAEADGANIRSASDALWWAYVTITTVGYGDRVPVTNSGRMIGLLVMTAGVVLFGVLTGYLANAFVPAGSQENDERSATGIDPREISEIKHLLDEQSAVNAEILDRLKKIEQTMDNDPR